VQQRAADAYIDAEAIRLTTWQAAWRLAADRPDHESRSQSSGPRSRAPGRLRGQHLHGGIGVDVDYPLHATISGEEIELTLARARASSHASARSWPMTTSSRPVLSLYSVASIAGRAQRLGRWLAYLV